MRLHHFYLGNKIPILGIGVELFFSRKQVPKEDKVTSQAVEGILKGSWLILLEKIMAHPGEAVAQNRNEGQEQPVKGKPESNKREHYQPGTHKVQAPAGGVLMFG